MRLFPPLPRAADAVEMLDGPAPFADRAQSLADVARLNALFGGRAVTLAQVKRLLAEIGAVDQAEMRHRRPGADLDAVDRRDVDDGAVLHVGAAADHDRREVGADHGVVPHRGVFLDGDVADDRRRRRHERGGMDARGLAFEREEGHRRLLDSMMSRRAGR